MSQKLDLILQDITASNMVATGDLQAAGLLVLTAALYGLDINRAGIWVMSADRQYVQGRLLLDGDNCDFSGQLLLQRHDYPAYFASIDQGQAVAADDAHRDPRTCEFSASYLSPYNITSMLDAPIREGDTLLGVICCEHQGPGRHWSRDEIDFACALADTYSQAIQAARAAPWCAING